MTGNSSPSLRSFLEQLDAKAPDQIWRIRDEVDRDYDVAAIISELERRGEYPVLWFDRVRGSRFPLVTNLFADRRRYAMALGVPPEALAEEWVARGERRIPPVLRSTGPVHDVVVTGADVDLAALPVLRHFAEDAGLYITNGIVIARDPDTGVRNASFHRMQVRGRDRVGTSLHSRRHLWDYQRRAEERAEPLPVAVVVGAHPLFHFGSGLWKGPIDVDVHDEREVLWAVATRMQADRDLLTIPSAMGAILDPSSRAGTTAKLVIDATRPLGGFARRHTLPPDALRRAAALLDAR